LGQPFLEEVDTELDVEVFLLEVVDMLLFIREIIV